MKSDHILVSSTSSCTVTGNLCMVLEGKTMGAIGLGRSSWPQYISLSCHKVCKTSLILKPWSWRSPGKNIEI